MAHHLYQTDTFVVGFHPSNEANCLYSLFTKDLGLIEAKAQGIRLNKSKLRYSLQGLSQTRVTLVRGKEYWRVVGAQEPTHYWISLKGQPEKLALVERFLSLVRRLIHGEERNESIYKTLQFATTFLLDTDSLTKETLHLLEIMIVARVLSALGYFEPKDMYKEILEGSEITEANLLKVNICKKELLRDINKALEESHL